MMEKEFNIIIENWNELITSFNDLFVEFIQTKYQYRHDMETARNNIVDKLNEIVAYKMYHQKALALMEEYRTNHIAPYCIITDIQYNYGDDSCVVVEETNIEFDKTVRIDKPEKN